MTREDVRAQLEKSPLEWEDKYTRFDEKYLVAPLRIGDISLELRIHHERAGFLRQSLLVLMFSSHREEAGELLVRRVNVLPTLEEMKAQAESHRLDLICQMLGITE